MAESVRRARSALSTAVVLSLAGLAAGCGGDEVRSYKVTRGSDKGAPAGPVAPEGGEYRILGAIFPADQPAWFFKLAGPADAVARAEAGFDQMVRTVRFPNGLGRQPTFTPPEGWKLGGPREGFVPIAETVLLPADFGGLEVTVTASRGGVFQNLDRWAGQLGLSLPEADVPKYTREFDADQVKGLRADLRGPNNPNAKRMGKGPGGR
jgi:hypothetical protein